MTTLFISHSSRDDVAVAELRDRLLRRGFESLFVDFDAEQGIPAGAGWERELLYKLRLAEAVVFVGSRASAASEWCLVELAFAHAARRPIFPVALERGVRVTSLQAWQWVELASSDGFERLVRALERRFDPARTDSWDHRRPPYPGLAPFQAADAAMFFGRDDVVASILERLDVAFGRVRAVALVGASGSGKSSIARAGVAPRVARDRDRWVVLPPLTPGERPLAALLRALAARGQDVDRAALQRDAGVFDDAVNAVAGAPDGEPRSVLLIVDQAEELLLLSAPEERERFLELIVKASGGAGPLWVLLTLRSEYLDAALRHQGLAALLGEPVPVSALDRSRLGEVILGPATRAGIEFAPGLVERMVEETRGGDALPLLAYTLRALHEHVAEGGATVTTADYDAVGGVVGALDRRADQVMRELGGERVLPTLLRLVTFGPDGEPARRRVPLSSFDAHERRILEAFVNARLLVTATRGDTTVVEPAHEALLRAWRPLADMIEASRERLQAQAEVSRAAEEWLRNDRNPSYLLRRDRLAGARRRLAGAERLDPTTVAFLDASDRSERAELEVAQRRARRLRRLNTALAALVLLAVAIAGFALHQTNTATARKREAQRQQVIASSRALASQSAVELSQRPGRALLLALAAYRMAPNLQTRNAVITAIGGTSRAEMTIPGTQVATFSGDDQRVVAVSKAGEAQLWSIRSRRLLARTPGRAGHYEAVATDRTGDVVAAAGRGRVALWRLGGGGRFTVLRPFGRTSPTQGITTLVSDDGARAAAVGPAQEQYVEQPAAARILDVASGRAVGRPLRAYPGPFAFSPRGDAFAGMTRRGITVWRVGPDGPHHPLLIPLARVQHRLKSLAFEDGGRTVVGVLDGRRFRWRLDGRPASPAHEALPARTPTPRREDDGRISVRNGGRTVATIRTLQPPASIAGALLSDYAGDISPNGDHLLLASAGGLAELWSVAGFDPLQRLVPTQFGVLAVAPEGRLAVVPALGRDSGSVDVFEPGRHRRLQPPAGIDGLPVAVAFGPGPDSVTAMYGKSHAAYLWRDIRTGRPPARIPLGSEPPFALAPDGRHAVTYRNPELSNAAIRPPSGRARPKPRLLLLWTLTPGHATATPVTLGRPASVGTVFFSGDGRTLAAQLSGRCPVAIWRMAQPRRRTCIAPGSGGGFHTSAALSQDGTLLATSDAAGEIRFWNARRGGSAGPPTLLPVARAIDKFGLGGDPALLAFAPDGRTLAALDADRGLLHLVDVKSRQTLGPAIRVPGATDPVNVFMTFSGDGTGLFVADLNGVFAIDGILWSSDLSAFRRRICGLLHRGLSRPQWRELQVPVAYAPQC